jgi:hypothetical protein
MPGSSVLVALWFPGGELPWMFSPLVRVEEDGYDVGHSLVNVNGQCHISFYPKDTIASVRAAVRTVPGVFEEDHEPDPDTDRPLWVSLNGREPDWVCEYTNLDADFLLKQARKIKADRSYNAHSRNCATVVGRLLEAAWKRYKVRLSLLDKLRHPASWAKLESPPWPWYPQVLHAYASALLDFTGGSTMTGTPAHSGRSLVEKVRVKWKPRVEGIRRTIKRKFGRG